MTPNRVNAETCRDLPQGLPSPKKRGIGPLQRNATACHGLPVAEERKTTRSGRRGSRTVLFLPNEAPPGEPVCLELVNEAMTVADGELVIPFGDHVWDSKRRIKQRINRQSAERIVAFFNSASQRLARLFLGMPIYVGHPDVPGFESGASDKRRYGRIVGMRVLPNGIGLEPKWNDLGEKNCRELYWAYWSPVLLAEEDKYVMEDGWKVYEPFGTKSVGLTNFPRMAVAPIALPNADQKGENMNLLEKLIALFGDKNITTEDQLLAKVTALIEGVKKLLAPAEPSDAVQELSNAWNANAAKLKALEAKTLELSNGWNADKEKIQSLEDQVRTERGARADLLLANALNEGRITEADRANWKTALLAEWDAKVIELANAKPLIKTKSALPADLAGRSGAAVDRQTKIIELVNERMKEKSEDYTTAFIAVQSDAKNAALFGKQ